MSASMRRALQTVPESLPADHVTNSKAVYSQGKPENVRKSEKMRLYNPEIELFFCKQCNYISSQCFHDSLKEGSCLKNVYAIESKK